MSTQYESLKSADLYAEAFGIAPPEHLLDKEVWPRKQGFFIRKAVATSALVDAAAEPATAEGQAPNAHTPEQHPEGEPPHSPENGMAQHRTPTPAPALLVMELAQGQFGLVPTWVKSASDAKLRSTKLAVTRYETMSTATPTRDTWLNAQRCIIPMQAFFEDDWRSGKAVSTRIARVDGKPMGVAGLWEQWTKAGETITSFTLLTVNANSHALMNRYQQNGNEKRMPAILNEGAYGAWLSAPLDKAREFMRAYPAHLLLANPVQKKSGG